MKGDFSKWQFDPKNNFVGVLHQQGRVLLDTDWNAQTRIQNNWQDKAGQDIIGSEVAAVPVSEPDSLKVTIAGLNSDGKVKLSIIPGRGWADGLPVCLPGDPATLVQRIATYLHPPIQDIPAEPIGPDIRDAVILEVWREAVNGFQMPETLIEPALGGPDTTERIQTEIAFRLLRLAEGENCCNIREKLKDDFSQKGKLKVSLMPTTIIPGDCPVVEGGGYTGFEHHLYRIEIAKINSGDGSRFKWSRFNGGLVGRGNYDSTESKFSITANLQAITTSGLTGFYLEVIERSDDEDYWKVTYGAEVVLNGSDLEVSTEHFNELGVPTENVFIRLWDEIRLITDFPKVTAPTEPNELRDGIRLEFDPVTSSNYISGDYWTFKVRAGEIENNEILIGKEVSGTIIGEQPEGIHYYRVPLAILNWDSTPDITFEEGKIDDCRDHFRPLTNQTVCCSFTVGDGKSSHGDFDSIEEAVRHLPGSGGVVCLLPGVHDANVQIDSKQNIKIRGCDEQTIVRPRQDKILDPIFKIDSSQNIQLEHMTLIAVTGKAIMVKDTTNTLQPSKQITIAYNQIAACVQAVSIEVNNQIAGNNDIWIAYNRIGMLDKPEGKPAIFTNADNVLIERNRIVVVPAPQVDDPNDPRDPDDPSGPVFDPCADPLLLYAFDFPIFNFMYAIFNYVRFIDFAQRITYQAEGGIQIGGWSERVKISGNEIIGGQGNGVTLGDLPEGGGEDQGEGKGTRIYASFDAEQQQRWEKQFKSFLYQITVEENTIQNMGSSGIGVVAFLSIQTIKLIVIVEDLTIYRNIITNCAQQLPEDIPETMLNQVGFGGIALADCENVVMQENRIENNGFGHIDPVCGIFILHGEKVDISNNRILNNGARRLSGNNEIKLGLRGGIVIGMSFKRLQFGGLPAIGSLSSAIVSREMLQPDGIPAAKIHGNIVTQPLGQALFLMAAGPVSVVGNHFTSQEADFNVNPISLLAGTVFILNLGISKDFIASVFLRFWYLTATSPANLSIDTKDASKDPGSFLGQLQRLLYLPGGNVLFANNQTTLDLRSKEFNLAISSQLIASLDDVAYNSNQSECTSLIDVVVTNTAIFAFSIRTNSNRFQEGVTQSLYSLFSYGFMNTATINQATHCLHVLGDPLFTVNGGNKVLYSTGCNDDFNKLQGRYAVGKAIGSNPIG